MGPSQLHCMVQGCLQYLSASSVTVWDFWDVSEQHWNPLPRHVPTSKCKCGCFMSDRGLSGSASHFCHGLIAVLKDRNWTDFLELEVWDLPKQSWTSLAWKPVLGNRMLYHPLCLQSLSVQLFTPCICVVWWADGSPPTSCIAENSKFAVGKDYCACSNL